jgi:hypothetical protein
MTKPKNVELLIDGEVVERCRRTRQEITRQFKTRAEFFTYLDQLQKDHDAKAGKTQSRKVKSKRRAKPRDK